MDGRRFDELAKGLTTWRTRRQVLTGTVTGAVGALLARLGARAESSREAMATPTESPGEAEAGGSPEVEREQSTKEVEQVSDNQRAEIAEVCRRAEAALREEQGFVDEYRRHPHPDQALAFVEQLRTLAEWGASQAESWDDAMLANYVAAASATALALRIGFDAYYELDTTLDYAQSEERREDPRTCFFNEIRKWQDCLEKRGGDSAGQMICFWDFMVLDSCTRCMRAF